MVDLFEQVKALFDPDNRMNPGKVVFPNRLDRQLRLGPDYAHVEPTTFFSYPRDEGRFSKVALRCVGIGTCRSLDSDEQVMCPSYMVTREEEHSTRGRARLLFEMIRGTTITDGWRSTEVRDALDLCLACKGCKSDCPVNVDMATYKAEFLAHHYRGRLRPMAHYSMGWLPVWARLAGCAPRAVNAVTSSPLAPLIKRAGGIAPERPIPRFAPQTFVSSWRRRPAWSRPAAAQDREPVLLWPDCFSNSFHPNVAGAAVRVLEDAGFEVRVPHRAGLLRARPGCRPDSCTRPRRCCAEPLPCCATTCDTAYQSSGSSPRAPRCSAPTAWSCCPATRTCAASPSRPARSPNC